MCFKWIENKYRVDVPAHVGHSIMKKINHNQIPRISALNLGLAVLKRAFLSYVANLLAFHVATTTILCQCQVYISGSQINYGNSIRPLGLLLFSLSSKL